MIDVKELRRRAEDWKDAQDNVIGVNANIVIKLLDERAKLIEVLRVAMKYRNSRDARYGPAELFATIEACSEIETGDDA